jgi:hypothetical protein
MSLALAAYGAQLQRGDGGGPEVFTTIAEVTKIEGPPLKQDVADVTADPITAVFTVTATTTTMTVPVAILLPVGRVIRVASSTTLPTPLTVATDYYVVSSAGGSVTVSLTPGGAVITFADAGTGTHTLTTRTSFREQVPTLRDAGEITMDISFVPTNAQQGFGSGLVLDLTNKTKRNFKLIFPDTSVFAVSAFVVGFKASAAVAGVLTAAVTLRISGQPTLV